MLGVNGATESSFQAKLTLLNGETEITINWFLGGRTVDTVTLGKPRTATPFDPNDPAKVL